MGLSMQIVLTQDHYCLGYVSGVIFNRKIIIAIIISSFLLSASILLYRSSLDDYQPLDSQGEVSTEVTTETIADTPNDNKAMDDYLQANVVTFQGMKTKSSEKVFSDGGFDVLAIELVNDKTDEGYSGLALAKEGKIIVPPGSDISPESAKNLGIPQSIFDFIMDYNKS